MKNIFFVVFFLLLSGCKGKLPLISWDMLEKGKEEKAFIGYTQVQIEDRWGKPFIVRREADYEMHCYRQGACSMLVFFDPIGKARYIEKRGSCYNEAE